MNFLNAHVDCLAVTGSELERRHVSDYLLRLTFAADLAKSGDAILNKFLAFVNRTGVDKAVFSGSGRQVQQPFVADHENRLATEWHGIGMTNGRVT